MSWVRACGEQQSLKYIPVASLDPILCLWLIDHQQAIGTEYEPNSLTSYLSAIKCYSVEIDIDNKKLHDKQSNCCKEGVEIIGVGKCA